MTVQLVFTADAPAHRVDRALLGESGDPNFQVSGDSPTIRRHDVKIERSGQEIQVLLYSVSSLSELSGANANKGTEKNIRAAMPGAVSWITTEEVNPLE